MPIASLTIGVPSSLLLFGTLCGHRVANELRAGWIAASLLRVVPPDPERSRSHRASDANGILLAAYWW
jgi:hypothetical protein